MKTQFATTLGVCLAAVLGVGVAIQPARAAVTNLMTVKLAVATNIGKTELPAGEYTVRDIQTGRGTAVLEFTSTNGHSVNALVREIPTAGNEDSVRSEVVLRGEEGSYQIDKVWMQGHDHGYQLIPSEMR